MSGGGGTNTVQKSDPWEGQQQYLRDIFQNAQRLFNSGPTPFYGEAGAPKAPTAPTREEYTNVIGGKWVPATNTGPTYYNPGGSQGPAETRFDQAGFDKAQAKYQQDLATYNNYLKSLQDPTTVKTLAPVANETYQALDAATGAVPGMQQLGQSAAEANQFALTGAIDVRNNPFLSAAMQASIDPMVSAFTGPGGVLNTVRDQFGTAGQYGSDRQALATGFATQGLSDSIGNVVAKMGSEAYGQGLEHQARGLALLPQTQQSLLAPAQTLDAVGMQRRQLEQDYINEAIRRYDHTTQSPFQNLAQYSSLIQGNFGGTSTTSMDPGRTPALNAALSGAALGYSAYASGMLGAGVSAGAATGIGALGMLALAMMQ